MELYHLYCDVCNCTMPHYLTIKIGESTKKSVKNIVFIGVYANAICLDCNQKRKVKTTDEETF